MADSTLSVGAALPGEQFAVAAASLFKLADTIFSTMNTPEMLLLRQREDIQKELARMDATLKDAQAGDKDALKKLDSEISG